MRLRDVTAVTSRYGAAGHSAPPPPRCLGGAALHLPEGFAPAVPDYIPQRPSRPRVGGASGLHFPSSPSKAVGVVFYGGWRGGGRVTGRPGAARQDGGRGG